MLAPIICFMLRILVLGDQTIKKDIRYYLYTVLIAQLSISIFAQELAPVQMGCL